MKKTRFEEAEAMPEGSPEEEPLVPKKSKKRFMYSDMVPREVKTSKTLASVFLGEKSRAEHLLFSIGASTKEMAGATYMLWAFWYIGAFVGLAVVAGFADPRLVWCSFLMLPLPLIALLLSSMDLVYELFCTMDLYIIYILQFAFLIDGVVYCRADHRRIYWYCYFPTMLAAGLVDAYPAKYRAAFAKLFFSNAVVILAIFNALLVFKWQAFGDHSKLSHVAFSLHHISDQLTLLCFYGRHLWCSVYYPDHFVMIKGEVITGRQQHLDSPERQLSPKREDDALPEQEDDACIVHIQSKGLISSFKSDRIYQESPA